MKRITNINMKTFLSGLLTDSSSAKPKIAKRAEFLVSYNFDTRVNTLKTTRVRTYAYEKGPIFKQGILKN